MAQRISQHSKPTPGADTLCCSPRPPPSPLINANTKTRSVCERVRVSRTSHSEFLNREATNPVPAPVDHGQHSVRLFGLFKVPLNSTRSSRLKFLPHKLLLWNENTGESLCSMAAAVTSNIFPHKKRDLLNRSLNCFTFKTGALLSHTGKTTRAVDQVVFSEKWRDGVLK